MSVFAPLRATVELRLKEGVCAGQRRFRLSRNLGLGSLDIEGQLPCDDACPAEVRFFLPDGQMIRAAAKLAIRGDEDTPAWRVDLLGLDETSRQQIQQYIEQRLSL